MLARVLSAHKKSVSVGGESVVKALEVEPTVNLLNRARDLMLVVSAWEVAIQRLVLLAPVEEQQHNKQAAEEDDAYNSHCSELGPREQPRAWSTAPTRSLPATTRPAGAGW